jgi:hypothetical protein
MALDDLIRITIMSLSLFFNVAVLKSRKGTFWKSSESITSLRLQAPVATILFPEMSMEKLYL